MNLVAKGTKLIYSPSVITQSVCKEITRYWYDYVLDRYGCQFHILDKLMYGEYVLAIRVDTRQNTFIRTVLEQLCEYTGQTPNANNILLVYIPTLVVRIDQVDIDLNDLYKVKKMACEYLNIHLHNIFKDEATLFDAILMCDPHGSILSNREFDLEEIKDLYRSRDESLRSARVFLDHWMRFYSSKTLKYKNRRVATLNSVNNIFRALYFIRKFKDYYGKLLFRRLCT